MSMGVNLIFTKLTSLMSLNTVGHTSFYVKTKLGVLYKDRTPGSDPVKGGLFKGNVVEVDLENTQ